MQASSDKQQMDRLETRMDRFDTRMDRLDTRMDRLETKVDTGFAEMRGEIMAARSDARQDFRTLLAIMLPMFLTMILGFAGILLQHL
jgi:outer membrane murein-binding lipoprotein Lpp